MKYIYYYDSPLGRMAAESDGAALTALRFSGGADLPGMESCNEKASFVFTKTALWLDTYFSGHEPGFTPPVSLCGTSFQFRMEYPVRDTVRAKQRLTRYSPPYRKKESAAPGGAGRRRGGRPQPDKHIIPCTGSSGRGRLVG